MNKTQIKLLTQLIVITRLYLFDFYFPVNTSYTEIAFMNTSVNQPCAKTVLVFLINNYQLSKELNQFNLIASHNLSTNKNDDIRINRINESAMCTYFNISKNFYDCKLSEKLNQFNLFAIYVLPCVEKQELSG